MSKVVDYRALDSRVLCVAIRRVEGAWCAYIGVVPGENHEREIMLVNDHGNKLPESIALEVFPQFKEEKLPYAW